MMASVVTGLSGGEGEAFGETRAGVKDRLDRYRFGVAGDRTGYAREVDCFGYSALQV